MGKVSAKPTISVLAASDLLYGVDVSAGTSGSGKLTLAALRTALFAAGAGYAADPLQLAAGTTGAAALKLPHGVAPTAPVDGDVWTTSAGMYARISGATVGPFGAGGGGGGDALTSSPLSQFAATTSAQLRGVISDETGSGVLVFATSPTLVTPVLGTPASGNLSNCTALNASQLATGTVPTARLGTGTANSTTFLRGDGSWQSIPGGGDALTSSPLSQFAATTSAQLAGVISDETGTGALVFANSPVFTTPNIGTATGSVSGNAGTATALATARTINGVSFNGTANITVTAAAATLTGTTLPALIGTALTSLNATNIASGTLAAARLPATAALTTATLAQFAATTSAQLRGVISDETGSGVLVFATNPTLAGATFSAALAMADNEVRRAVLLDTAEKVHAMSFSATPTFDYASASGTHKTMTLTGNVTGITISNWPASGRLGAMTLFLLDDATGGRTIAGWPAAVDWGDDGAPPAGVASKLRIITLLTTDGGTNIYGAWKAGHA